jgi:sporulation protein YlmC with PRC-barrel domain
LTLWPGICELGYAFTINAFILWLTIFQYGGLMVQVGELNGKKVITTDAFEVGKVSGAEMDGNWKITHLHVNLTKEATDELGFKKPMLGHVTICLPISLVQGFRDVITLNKNRKDLKGIPECRGN